MSLLEVLKKAREIVIASPRVTLNFNCINHCCQGFYPVNRQIRHSAFSALYLASNPDADGLFAEIAANPVANVRVVLDNAIERDFYFFTAGKNSIRMEDPREANLALCQIFKRSLNREPRYQRYNNTYQDCLFIMGMTDRIYYNNSSIKVFNKAICFLEAWQKKPNEAI